MTGMKKKLEKAWFSLVLFGFICIGIFRIFQDPDRKMIKRDVNKSFPADRFERQLKELKSEFEMRTQQERHVTKSLNDVETDFKLSDHVLFFNRVPKTGGEMFVLLLQWLQGNNGFRHVRLPGGEKRRLTSEEQEDLVEKVTKIIKNEAIPVSFDRHVYFTNFTRFDKQTPTFINLVRDPIDKAVSRFYYGRVTPNPNNPDIKYATRRTTKAKPVSVGNFEDCVTSRNPECSFKSGNAYDLTIPYFCGQEKQCMILNSKWALQRAKKNVDKYYPVVGVLEELNSTLAVLEKTIPLFFKGLQDMYYYELLGKAARKLQSISSY